MSTAIITYGWCRNAYAAVRCLSRHNVKVIVGGPEKIMMAGCSRYAEETFTYPSPYTQPEQFIRIVSEMAKRYDAQVYIPIHEEIIPVAKYRHLLPENLAIPISSYESIITAHDKGLTMTHAESIGVPVPKTFQPKDIDDVSKLARGITYPVLIKLRRSNSAKGIFKVTNPEELKIKYREVVQAFDLHAESLPIIQAFIPGNVYAVSMLFNKGKMITKFTRKNIREKTYGGGTCTKCVSVINRVLEDYAERMLASLNWHGVAMMEFKYDEHTGEGFLLEINPRYHGTIDHDIACGIPTPYFHYLMDVNGDVDPLLEYRLGLTSRWILGDLIGMIDHLPKTNNRFDYLKQILRFDEDNYMDLKRDDLMPFFVQAFYYLKKFIRTGSRNPADDGMLG